MTKVHDCLTEVHKDDGGKWYVSRIMWVDGGWKSLPRLTGFRTRKAAVTAAHGWRREQESKP